MKTSLFWFRRDLRLEDNAGLYHALKHHSSVMPIFIFDTDILDQLDNKADARLEFIHETLKAIHSKLEETGSGLHIFHGKPLAVFQKLIDTYSIDAVYTNHDYEPYAINRDEEVRKLLHDHHISFNAFKDQVIFEKNEVIKDNGEPYTVFTPYSKKWKSILTDFHLKPYPTQKYFSYFLQQGSGGVPALSELGFMPSGAAFPSSQTREDILKHYATERDFPGIKGTSRLGVHLRFGTISIRALAKKASSLSGTYLNELIWREFYQMILYHFPQVAKGKSFKPAYDRIHWRHNDEEFAKWCNGETGYPIVDAGMRELNATGFMHNRVRMITASFLCKHLLLDWRLGEAYFAEKLLDYELASNNGGWQWAAGSGCDAAPYFRIFNPYLQTKKFDPHFTYIKQWVPEFQEFNYPPPVVNHEFARERCLKAYSQALKKN